MNRTQWQQVRRMQKFRDVLSRWEARQLSGLEAAEILGMSDRTFRDLANQVGGNERNVAWTLQLALLAPDIVAAIIDGTHPHDLTATTLIKARNLSIEWTEQRQQFGFTEPI